jgi:hypothetical protein
MNENNDLLAVTSASMHFERLLRDKYRAKGGGLTRKTKSVETNLPPSIVANLKYLAQVRNKIVHGDSKDIPDKDRFEEACTALEKFFNETIPKGPPPLPVWISPSKIGFFKKPFFSSQENRLFSRCDNHIVIYNVGRHSLKRRKRELDEVGYINMQPQSIKDIELSTIFSKDGLEIVITLHISTKIIDDEKSIRAMIFDPDQQIETLMSYLLTCMQNICSKYDYDNLKQSLTEVSFKLVEEVNETVQKKLYGSLELVKASIASCEIEDSSIELTRRQQQRNIEITKSKARALKYKKELESVENELVLAKAELQRQQALVSEEHATRLAEIQVQTEKAHSDINIEKQLRELEIVRQKAEIAKSAHGKFALYPKMAHEIERSRLIQNAELLRATLSEKKVLQLLTLAASAGFSRAETEVLKTNFQGIFSETKLLSQTDQPSENNKSSNNIKDENEMVGDQRTSSNFSTGPDEDPFDIE